MIKGSKGEMNIPFSEVYDKDSDVYYVSFNTGEPSFVEEVDDSLLLEVGIFTKMPTGFRILNFTKQDVKAVALFTREVRRTIQEVKKDARFNIEDREEKIERGLNHVFSQ